MKMSNKDILEAVENLNSTIQDCSLLPASVSYAVIRNFKILSPIAEDIYNERKKIIERYGEKVDDITYQISEEKREAANQELNALLAVNTSVPLATFSIDILQGYDIPLKVMNTLYFMVEADEE